MNPSHIITQKFIDANDPHGYCNNLSGQASEIQDIVKRCKLNRDICRLYHRHGLSCPIPHYDNQCIRYMLNIIVKSRRPKIPEALQHVRRKLFRESRSRKNSSPRNKVKEQSKFLHIKDRKNPMGLKRIRRGYLKEARIVVKNEILLAIQRKCQMGPRQNIEMVSPNQLTLSFDNIAESILTFYMRQQHRIQRHQCCQDCVSVENLQMPIVEVTQNS